MQRSQFTFYESFARAIFRIKKKADRADTYDAIVNYALYGIEPSCENLSPAVAIAFELIKPTLDASAKKANSGKAGGKQNASKTQANGKQNASKTQANGKQNASEKEKEKEKENEKEGEIENELENECLISPSSPFGGALDEAVHDWLRYKREKRQEYKQTGLKSLYTQIGNAASAYGEQAVVQVIRQSMAANYQGILFARLGEQQDGNVFAQIARESIYDKG